MKSVFLFLAATLTSLALAAPTANLVGKDLTGAVERSPSGPERVHIDAGVGDPWKRQGRGQGWKRADTDGYAQTWKRAKDNSYAHDWKRGGVNKDNVGKDWKREDSNDLPVLKRVTEELVEGRANGVPWKRETERAVEGQVEQ